MAYTEEVTVDAALAIRTTVLLVAGESYEKYFTNITILLV